jgi:hypothetical protein
MNDIDLDKDIPDILKTATPELKERWLTLGAALDASVIAFRLTDAADSTSLAERVRTHLYWEAITVPYEAAGIELP